MSRGGLSTRFRPFVSYKKTFQFLFYCFHAYHFLSFDCDQGPSYRGAKFEIFLSKMTISAEVKFENLIIRESIIDENRNIKKIIIKKTLALKEKKGFSIVSVFLSK